MKSEVDAPPITRHIQCMVDLAGHPISVGNAYTCAVGWRVLKLRFLVTPRVSEGNTRVQCVPRLRVGFPFSEEI